MLLDRQSIVIIRHAEPGSDGITDRGRDRAIEKGRELTESILRQLSPNGIVLFASTSPRVQETIEAIREGMGLDPNYPIHSLPLDGKYSDVSESEIWEPLSIIKRVSGEVGQVLICTNGQYVQRLAEYLGKYGGIPYNESSLIKSNDEDLDFLGHIHWDQKLVGEVPGNAVEVMGDDFGKAIPLSNLLKDIGKSLDLCEGDLKDYMKQRAGYFDRKYVSGKDFFEKYAGITSISDEILTYNPRIETDDAGETIIALPTKEEYMSELIRASSYLGGLEEKQFIHPVQWLKYLIGYHGDLFR